MNKKYYWLKLQNNFFLQGEIKKLRTLENGYLYTLIYLKLQLLSITTDGQLFSTGLENSIIQDLALELDETEENVQNTIFFLEKYHLLERIDADCLLLTKVAEIIGSEASSTERVRRMRKHHTNSALQCNSDVTKCNTEIELELEIKKERESKINTELNPDQKTIAATKQELPEKELPAEIAITSTPALKITVPATTEHTATTKALLIGSVASPVTTTLPAANILPTNLSPRKLRLARENLQDEQQTALALQVITGKILAHIQNDPTTIPAPLPIAEPLLPLENTFADFWKYYPNAYDQASTFKIWEKTLAQGIAATDLIFAAKKYALQIKNNHTELRYVSSSRNFLLNNKFWDFMPTYSSACPHCQGKGVFAKDNPTGEQEYYRCNCHQRYQNLSDKNSALAVGV